MNIKSHLRHFLSKESVNKLLINTILLLILVSSWIPFALDPSHRQWFKTILILGLPIIWWLKFLPLILLILAIITFGILPPYLKPLQPILKAIFSRMAITIILGLMIVLTTLSLVEGIWSRYHGMHRSAVLHLPTTTNMTYAKFFLLILIIYLFIKITLVTIQQKSK